MNRLAYKFLLCVSMLSALFAVVSAQSTPNKASKGDEQFALRPVVNPGTLYSTKEAALASLGAKVPPNLEILKCIERGPGRATITGWYVVEKTPIITGSDLQHAQAQPAMVGSEYLVAFKLKPNAAEKFREWTKVNAGVYLAIVLDGVVISAPIVRGEIPNGDGVIDGAFTREEAENLSVKLRRN
jgi:preprotein translocase subunit SecD